MPKFHRLIRISVRVVTGLLARLPRSSHNESRKSLVVIITFGLLGLCPLLLRAEDQEPSIDSMIEILEPVCKRGKATIVATGMNLSARGWCCILADLPGV